MHRPQVTRSAVRDKRKHGEVEGGIIDGQMIRPTGEPVEMLIERGGQEGGLGEDIKSEESGTVSWCRF